MKKQKAATKAGSLNLYQRNILDTPLLTENQVIFRSCIFFSYLHKIIKNYSKEVFL